MREKKWIRLCQRLSIRAKLLMTFALTAVLMLAVNVLLYSQVNHTMERLDEVYATNVSLSELAECLEDVQNNVFEYLNTKSTVSLEAYYRNEQTLRDMLGQLNSRNLESERKLLEKSIRNMSETYLDLADETVQAKRGRNAERYNAMYTAVTRNYEYIQSAVYRLNDMQFHSNSQNYRILLNSLNYMELVSSGVMILAAVISLIILMLLNRTIMEPLSLLARSANEVAAGNFDVELSDTGKRDEVGVVTHAFVKMIRSVREYIRQTKESMEKEQRMMERELLMETHLKDAQLKYLQAQINPHFLFNSLNAGAQLAMMEDAEKTSVFIEKMADYFRYNVSKTSETATLAEEIEAVDNYVYILNVRFAGDIHYEKNILPGVEEVRLPSMILQPIVENAVNHGIRNVEWEGHIWLTVDAVGERLRVTVRDNGQGMTESRIREVLSGGARASGGEQDSTGIGMDNVIKRLELFFGETGLLDIRSGGPGKGTEIRILIPMTGREKLG